MLISVEEALSRALEGCAPLPSEWIGIGELDGRVAATTLHARWDLPQRDLSVMDGYAVRSLDIANARACGNAIVLQVRGESAAGHPAEGPLQPGEALRIFTGAVLPEGADAVIAQEDTRREGERLVIDDASLGELSPGTFVRPRGQELREGDVLVRPGDRLGPGDIALLAGSGHAQLEVVRRARVAILGTGDELVAVGQRPGPGQVVSSNGLVLEALVRRAGAEPIALGDVGDEHGRLREALVEGLRADVLVTSGGISVGDHDLVHGELIRLGAVTEFRGVALRPGKPTTYATVFAEGDDAPTRVFALPGNPASSLVTFALFVHPVLRRLGGITGDPRLPRRQVTLRGPARGAGRRAHYLRASLVDGEAVPLSAQQSGDLRSIAGAELLIPVPPGVAELAAGTRVEAIELEPSMAERAPRR
ncbi:MAG: molybdopterin molybdotransferase MoeA [Myxococcales bacterium]|nr:molybdopterin molybdotransferase MoeA [Myxococcales bacterium]MCB9716345.1 molybdopterin molybdotransferase MoeA [Myxococcales bacterium]